MKIRVSLAAMVYFGLTTFGLTVLLAGCTVVPPKGAPTNSVNTCLERRIAFDIGSGSSKFQVADVDICQQKIFKSILEGQNKVDYKDDLSQSQDHKFGDKIQKEGLAAIENSLDLAKKNGVVSHKQMAGVATAAFREAQNAAEFTARIQAKTGLSVHVISQREEGILGYYSALASTELYDQDSLPNVKNLFVWDIGGGSAQMTYRMETLSSSMGSEGGFQVYEGKLASVSFKNQFMTNVQNKSEGKTPNPISRGQSQKGLRWVESYAQKNTPSEVKELIKHANGIVYGIGGVLSISVRNQTGKKQFKLQDIMTAIEQRLGKSDEEIGGKYASTDLTNLILVAGYMKALGVVEVRTLRVNNTSGILINPRYWLVTDGAFGSSSK